MRPSLALQQHRDEIRRIALSHRVTNVRVFGSVLHGEDTEGSDLDLLVEYQPKVSVSALVNSLKGVSCRMLRKERPDMQDQYWKGVLWSPSYFVASCGGAPISSIKQYIEKQETPA